MNTNDHSSSSQAIQNCLDRLGSSDHLAREHLISPALHRLTVMTRKMLGDFPGVHRWELTDDVLQNVSLRLWNSLQAVQPKTAAHFYRLAALHIRRELIDLARTYFGPEGIGANYSSHLNPQAQSGEQDRLDIADLTHEPSRILAWAEFHQQVDLLPDDEREVFELLWYQGLSQVEVASLLDISDRSVRRLWRRARLTLHESLQGELPPI